MIRNKDFALPYAGRAVFNKNGEYAGVAVGWNDIGVSEDEFLSYEYRNAGMPEEQTGMPVEEAPKHKTIGELIREHEGVTGIQFEHGGISMGDGVSSKIWEEKVWGDKVWRH